jgi:sugar lactone lactonase YvrE
MRTLLTGIAFGESPRWHEGRLWFADWGTQELLADDLEGESEVVARAPSSPFCIDWLPDGRLLVVSGEEGRLLRREPDGSLVTHADLTGLGEHPLNDIVVDGRGNAYVGNIGFDFGGGKFAPGTVAVVTPEGSSRQVAEGVAFPNGMAVTPDDSTLIVAESYGNRLTAFDIAADGGLSNRRLWARARRGSAGRHLPQRGGRGLVRRRAEPGAACGSPNAARCCRRSSSTAGASPACSAVRMGGRCSWSRGSGAARRAWLPRSGAGWAQRRPLP